MKRHLLTIATCAVIATASIQVNAVQNDNVNPFLVEYTTEFEIPPFDQIKTEHYLPALVAGIEEQNREIEAIISGVFMKELDVVRLTKEFEGLPAGTEGTIVRLLPAIYEEYPDASDADVISMLVNQLVEEGYTKNKDWANLLVRSALSKYHDQQGIEGPVQ